MYVRISGFNDSYIFEEFWVPMTEPVRHQYYIQTHRRNRLLQVGHRCRGDVLTA